MPVLVRNASPADLPALVGLLGDLFGREPDFRIDAERQRRGLCAMLSDRQQRVVLVAEAEGQVVGMVTGQLVVSTAEGGPSCLVEDLVVAGNWRRQGIGGWLLDQAEGWARGHGATRLQLVADRENEGALRFYDRRGWRRTRMVALHRAP